MISSLFVLNFVIIICYYMLLYLSLIYHYYLSIIYHYRFYLSLLFIITIYHCYLSLLFIIIKIYYYIIMFYYFVMWIGYIISILLLSLTAFVCPTETVHRFYPDITNCSAFYECVNNIAYHRPFEADLFFNPAISATFPSMLTVHHLLPA